MLVEGLEGGVVGLDRGVGWLEREERGHGYGFSSLAAGCRGVAGWRPDGDGAKRNGDQRDKR